MAAAGRVVVLDVNETLSDMSAMAARFVEVGAPASFTPMWFAAVLRDGFALTLTGRCRGFSEIAGELLRVFLPEAGKSGTLEESVRHVMAGFTGLEVHPDVRPAVNRLSEDGHRLVTFSNGEVSIGEQLLTKAGIRDAFEQILSVEEAGAWKPARAAYEHAVRRCEVAPEQMLLVAVHPWDIDGAAHAGLETVWVNRTASHYPTVFTAPAHTVTSLEELPDLLG